MSFLGDGQFGNVISVPDSDRPNLAPARASGELFGRSFGRSSFGGDVPEAEAYLFTILDTFAVLFVQFFNFF